MSYSPSPPCSGVLSFRGLSVIETGGHPWLIARDVLSILGLDVSRSPGRFLASLPEADRPLLAVTTSHGLQRTRVISPAAAVALTQQRKRPVDADVRSFLTGSATILGASNQ
jgi:prophage antirepressor-like protein